MREPLDKILQKLSVQQMLAPYETQPWFHYDEERGLTCSAEVRMGAGGQDIEAEIQLLKDDEDEGDGEAGDNGFINGRAQILWMRIEPAGDNKWSPKNLRIKGKSYVNEIHDWEGKGCQFFRSTVEAMLMGEIPDFDELETGSMQDDVKGRGSSGRVGRKSPKANPAALMGMKK